jgi:methionyl-tRNA formyltransferase
MPAKPLRIVFLGSGAIALPVLDWLAGPGRASAELAGIFTQPDRPAGRGLRPAANPVKEWSRGRGLPVFEPTRLGEEERGQLAALSADLGLVFAYGKILGEAFFETPRLGMVNLHASLLPKYRGASPVQTAVACGESTTGVTLMRVARELDAGPIAGSVVVAVGALDTAADVEKAISAECPALLASALDAMAGGRIAFVEQDHSRATYCRRLRKDDGQIDFSSPSPSLAARINGLNPWPGCAVDVGGEIVKIGQADALPGTSPAAAGEILGSDGIGMLVGTGDGVLRLRRLQRAGGRMLVAAEFLRGFPIKVGAILPSRPMSRLVGETPFGRRP